MITYCIARESTQGSAVTQLSVGRKSKNEVTYVCICIADSLCCTVGTNTILQSNCTPINVFKEMIFFNEMRDVLFHLTKNSMSGQAN